MFIHSWLSRTAIMRSLSRKHRWNTRYISVVSILVNPNFDTKILLSFFDAHSDQSLRTSVGGIYLYIVEVSTIYQKWPLLSHFSLFIVLAVWFLTFWCSLWPKTFSCSRCLKKLPWTLINSLKLWYMFCS